MSTSIHFTPIRQAVLAGVSGLGVADPAISKTFFLIRDGYCIGQRFLFDGIQAVWLMAEDVIRFYADDGALLETVEIGQEPAEKKAA